MDWSGALALRTSRERQHAANYGSFRQYGLPRTSHEVLVPQSIPEDEPVDEFRSPLLRRELHEPAREETKKNNNSYASLGFISPSAARFRSGVSPRPQFGGATASNSSSMSSAEARKHERSQAFKRWLATDKQKRIDEIMKGTAGAPFGKDKASKPAARAAADENSTHWMQERERIRLQRMLRRAAEQEAEEDAPMPNWKMTAIMCSVPFVLLVVFFVLVMILGKDTRKAALAKMHIIHAAEFEHFGNGFLPSPSNDMNNDLADTTVPTPSSPPHLRALQPLANDIARAAARMPVSVDD